jgi:hypothetical protein
MKILFVVALTLLILIGPALVLVSAFLRRHQAVQRRRGFDVTSNDRMRD